MDGVSNEELAKALIKVGAVIAGADGLDVREKVALLDFVAQRSRLPSGVIESQIEAAKGGLSSITSHEISILKSAGLVRVGGLLKEGLQKIAGSDGNLSARELETLNAVWKLLG